MTRKEAMRQTMQADTLRALGFTYAEAEALRRISLTLRRWHEHECNGAIRREGDDDGGRPFWHSTYDGRRIGPAPDRERGALKRLKLILDSCNSRRAEGKALRAGPALGAPLAPLGSYIQTDPRGAALYILRPGDVPEGEPAESYYPRGICVY